MSSLRISVALPVLLFLVGSVADAIPVNIALNKPATASSTWLSNTPDLAVDGDPLTLWSATTYGTQSTPQWLLVDLLGVYPVTHITLFHRDTAPYSSYYYVDYVLKASVNGSDWDALAAGTLYDDPSDFPGDPIDNVDDLWFAPTDMRYVQFEAIGGTHWAHLWEMEVYPVPEPCTSALLLVGVAAVAAFHAARKRR